MATSMWEIGRKVRNIGEVPGRYQRQRNIWALGRFFLLVEIQSDLEVGIKVIDTCGEHRRKYVKEMAESVTLIE